MKKHKNKTKIRNDNKKLWKINKKKLKLKKKIENLW